MVSVSSRAIVPGEVVIRMATNDTAASWFSTPVGLRRDVPS
jgi:hypothetical protein